MLGKWSITIVTALVTATVLIGATVLLAGGSASSSADSTPPPLTTGMLTPPPLPRPQAQQGSAQRTTSIGPEGVPLTRGAPLGPARSPRFGSSSGGVPCGSREQLVYHV